MAPWVQAGVALHSDSALHVSQFPALSDGMLTMRLAGDVQHAHGAPLPAEALILPHAQARAYQHLGAVHVVGVVLRPAALPCLLGSSLTGLAGGVLPLDSLPDAAHWRRARQHVADAVTDADRLAQLYAALRQLLHPPRHLASLQGLRSELLPVIGGGISVMCAVFELLGLQQMRMAQGALRHGLLVSLSQAGPLDG